MGDISVVWVTIRETACYGPQGDLPSNLGAKARGLIWLPSAWVPPFFVVSPEVQRELLQSNPESRPQLLLQLHHNLEVALREVAIDERTSLLLRSNAVRETLQERGRYTSKQSSPATLAADILSLYQDPAWPRADQPAGLIVQTYVPPRIKGHLSNERRVAEEYRDGLIEMEDASGYITDRRISFRRWRQSRRVNDGALACVSERELSTVLREILALAAQRTKRVHFEWVWDGSFVHVVQADIADERRGGTNPYASLRSRSLHIATPANLRRFVEVSGVDSTAPGKLRNHGIYAQHGYWQPTFYQMPDDAAIGRILRGEDDPELTSDLAILTELPLVIRTSCTTHSEPLLPRSHQLTSVESALHWLRNEFAREINSRSLQPSELCLLAHHYIPAGAAAFSTGSQDRLEVYIEALWGIPEGLYYYPFDSYTVRTLGTDASKLGAAHYDRFQFPQSHRRHKSHFVAPDSSGQFVCHETSIPWDWKPTIADRDDLAEIASFTRKVAQREGHPVNVMWFLGCSTPRGPVAVVPWYHERLETLPSESAFRRNSRDEIVTIASLSDLEAFEKRHTLAPPGTLGRLVVQLSPTEDLAIRSEDFASRVGVAAKRLNAVVVLNGASLSHIYYVLARTKAEIVVWNLADVAARREMHQKLVRDRIPETVAAGGEVAHIASLSKEQILAALRIKLVEEAFEVRDASREDLASEIADVLEVLDSLRRTAGLSKKLVEGVRKNKAEKRGGFKEGIVLISTETDTTTPKADGELAISPEMLPRVVSNEKVPPLEFVKLGPADQRDAGTFFEIVQSGSVSLTHAQWTIESQRETRLPRDLDARVVDWTIDGQRVGTSLKLRLKIRLGRLQLSLPLDWPEENEDET